MGVASRILSIFLYSIMIQDFFMRLFNQLHHNPYPTPNGKDLILGVGNTETSKQAVIWREADRPMHLAIMGLSGVGKSYLLENLIRQDIQHGTGFVLFDVHGDLADNVVAFLAEQTGKNRDLAQGGYH